MRKPKDHVGDSARLYFPSPDFTQGPMQLSVKGYLRHANPIRASRLRPSRGAKGHAAVGRARARGAHRAWLKSFACGWAQAGPVTAVALKSCTGGSCRVDKVLPVGSSVNVGEPGRVEMPSHVRRRVWRGSSGLRQGGVDHVST